MAIHVARGIVFFCVMIQHLAQGAFQCPSDHALFGDQCLKPWAWSEMTWNEARGRCQSINASLLTIENEAKNEFIRDTSLCNSQCWLDLRRRNLGGPFVWQQTGSEASFVDWAPNNPDNGYERRCASMYLRPGQVATWYSEPCIRGHPLPYLCEKPALDGCEDDSWTEGAGSCYYLADGGVMSWTEAREACQSLEADLAVVETVEENELIKNIGEVLWAWIGLRRNDTDHWVWLDESNSGVSWFDWKHHHPEEKATAAYGDCAHMVALGGRGTWRAEDCQSSLSVICEKPARSDSDAGCDDGWSHREDRCYLVNLPTRDWSQGRVFCQTRGSDMVVIESEQENTYLNGLLPERNDAWIGLRSKDGSNVWTWLDHTSELDFHAFDSELPPQVQRWKANCVMLYTNEDNLGKWANALCNKPNGIICESPNHVDGWLEHRGKYYSIFTQDWRNWYAARRKCQYHDEDADLVVIDSHEKQRFINAHLQGTDSRAYWTGINSLQHRHKFVALDTNTEILYTNWDAGEPEYDEYESCVTVRSQQESFWDEDSDKVLLWEDQGCKQSLRPVCQSQASGEASFYDFQSDHSVYKYVMGNFTTAEGEEYCSSMFGENATLAKFSNDDYLFYENWLVSRFKAFGRDRWFWIGSSEGYVSPADESFEETCVLCHLEPSGYFEDQYYDCGWRTDILCEKAIGSSPDQPDFRSGDSVHKVMIEKAAENDTDTICASTLPDGGKLVDVQSQAELDEFRRELVIRHLGNEFEYWIARTTDEDLISESPNGEGGDCFMLNLPTFPEVSQNDALVIVPTSCEGTKKFICKKED